MNEAHNLLVELVEVVKTIPAEFTDDFTDLGGRIKVYLEACYESHEKGGNEMTEKTSKMKQIRWTKKRTDELRRCISDAFEGWAQPNDEYGRQQANAIHEFELMLNEHGLGDRYKIKQLTWRVKED